MLTLASLKKSSARKLHTILLDEISSKSEDFSFTQWYNAAIDAIKSKFYKSFEKPAINCVHLIGIQALEESIKNLLNH